MTTTDTILQHIAEAMDGQPFPAMRSDECRAIIAALDATSKDRALVQTVGANVVQLLLARAQSSLAAQRECAQMIDRGNQLC